MKICTVVGTRPNFMKAAPLIEEFKKHDVRHVLIHTGQHYDKEMSELFFEQLGMPRPDINLGVGSGSYSEQIGAVMVRLEKVFQEQKPDLVVVVGDVNSTLAAALVAKQQRIPVAHIEAGLRSFDLAMPEEINRMLTDRISDYLFTTENSANENLKREGVDPKKIHFVGNVMIDTLLAHKQKAAGSDALKRLGLEKGGYCVVTLHRPSNVDGKEGLEKMLAIISGLGGKMKIIFPIHPRTKKNLDKFSLLERAKSIKNLILTEPLGYLDFLCLMNSAALVLTDSGGIQEETTVLGVPCITLRENTERPVTVEQGTNMLVSTDVKKVIKAAQEVLEGKKMVGATVPKMWDGKAAERIVRIILGR